mmetsp:Transcript_58899/g.190700  ORF Transcript_58899/g.190700 Transcript_58899/m.190700 type:complete len:83 (+) Transcript_58899:442-690(+)
MFDVVNVVTALHRLARYSHPLRTHWIGGQVHMVDDLVGSLACKAAEMRVQQLANIAWSFARLVVRHEPLWEVISEQAILNLH